MTIFGIADDALGLAVLEERLSAFAAISKSPLDVVLAAGCGDLAIDVLIVDVLALILEDACARAEGFVGVAEGDDDFEMPKSRD